MRRRTTLRYMPRRPPTPPQGPPPLSLPHSWPAPGGRRRDRHGRGLRGPLLPRDVPAWRSRAERFDDYVLDAVERLEPRWGRELDGVELAVEDVPPDDPAPWEHGDVPLGRFFPAQGSLPARIVVYRRPVETRAPDSHDLPALVHDVVVEQVAQLLGLAPEQIDPRYGEES
jgi:predicted Zn-dependent protease with MMP-like domain